MTNGDGKRNQVGKARVSRSFFTGAVALVFLVIGYQTALLIQRAAVARILSNRDNPDTVFVYRDSGFGNENLVRGDREGIRVGSATKSGRNSRIVRKEAPHGRQVMQARHRFSARKYECFEFNPNTATVGELMRLGFSRKQAECIDRYRSKGGKFSRKQDFAKSFAVSDSVYARLEPYICIPKVDINCADSAQFRMLPGIGPYFAAGMVSYRKKLGGYSCKEQLTDIKYFDSEKLEALTDLITVSEPEHYGLWTLSADSLALHPYIGRQVAKSIVFFRENNPKGEWTLENLLKAAVISPAEYENLSKCKIADP